MSRIKTFGGAVRFAGIAISLVLAIGTLGGCGGNIEPSELPYLKNEVVVAGLAADEFTITIEDLTKLEAVSKKAEGKRSNGDTVKLTAVGPTLETFLAAYGNGKTAADFSAARFTGTDGYSIAIPREILEKREIVLAYMDGGKAFDKNKSAPLRAVVLGERAMYWARMVNRIEFEIGSSEWSTQKAVFFENAFGALESVTVDGIDGELVSVIDMLAKYGGMTESGKVYMAAYDGLRKNEKLENFLKGYINKTGENAPQFCSPVLPEGMNLNGIVTLRTGDTLYVSLARGAEVWEARTGGGKTGVGFTNIVKDQGFSIADSYTLTDGSGQTAVFEQEAMVKGVFAKDADVWSFYPESGEPVIGVVTVEAAEG